MYASYYGAYIDDYAILQTSVYMQFTYVEIYTCHMVRACTDIIHAEVNTSTLLLWLRHFISSGFVVACFT